MKTFTSDGKYSVYNGKTEIARSYVNTSKGRRYEVKILQWMPRMETIHRICNECPDFASSNDITPDYYPYLFSSK